MFRNHKYNLHLACSADEIFSDVLVTDDKGNVRIVSKPVSEINKDMPEPSEYTLEALINANVPLNVVPCSIDDEISQESIERFVNDNLKLDENEN